METQNINVEKKEKMDSKTGMYYLNYNIQRVENLLLEPDMIRKIAVMRVDAGDLFPVVVKVRIWSYYNIDMGTVQPGEHDDYNPTDRLELTFTKKLVVNNELPSLYDLTKLEIEKFISDLKEQAEKCPRCGSTNIRKHGLESHANGEYLRFQCKECYNYFVPEWTL